MIIAIFFQVVVPALLLFYFIQGTRTALSMLARAVIVVGALWAIRTLSDFLIVPWYAIYLYFVVMALVALGAVFLRRQITLSPRRRAATVLRLDMIVGLLMVNLNIFLLLGEAPDFSNVVSLDPPVLGKSVFVKNGGSHALLNGHIPPFWANSEWNKTGVKPAHYYGLDLVVVNDDGRPSSAWMPRIVFDYTGYGINIYSPCTGVFTGVDIDTVDEIFNEELGVVSLSCGSFEVQLAHLLRHTITLKSGARIVSGQKLGELGAVEENQPPWLHMHVLRREVQTDGSVKVIPVQVRIGDNFLAKGDIAP